jgi:hypothetical protein
MWRKSVHEDVGYFNENLRSASDWEFWMRCVIAGKKFFKINDPHVVYYVNPDGISTSVAGPGIEEGLGVTKRLMRQLLPPALLEDFGRFQRRCGVEAEEEEDAEPVSGRYSYVQSLLCEVAYAAESGRRGIR